MKVLSSLIAALLMTSAPAVFAEEVTEGRDREFLRFLLPSEAPDGLSDRGCAIPAQPRLENPDSAPVNANPDQASSVLLSIYRRQNAERIVAEGKCTCGMYFADWDAALDEMSSVFSAVPFNEWAGFRRENSRQTNVLASQVRQICTESGVL